MLVPSVIDSERLRRPPCFLLNHEFFTIDDVNTLGEKPTPDPFLKGGEFPTAQIVDGSVSGFDFLNIDAAGELQLGGIQHLVVAQIAFVHLVYKCHQTAGGTSEAFFLDRREADAILQFFYRN